MRSTTAIVLMAMLFFIHAVKFLHTHHNSSLHPPFATKAERVYIAGGSLTCSICDFEYLRDAVVPGCTIAIQPPAGAMPATGEFLFSVPACGVLTTATRGPPATA